IGNWAAVPREGEPGLAGSDVPYRDGSAWVERGGRLPVGRQDHVGGSAGVLACAVPDLPGAQVLEMRRSVVATDGERVAVAADGPAGTRREGAGDPGGGGGR